VTADRWFAYIATVDDGDDWQDELAWRKANPSLGVVLQIEDLRAEVALAREMPTRQNSIRRLRLNQWTQQLVRWIPMEVWADGAEAIDAEALRGAGASQASTWRGSTTCRRWRCCFRGE